MNIILFKAQEIQNNIAHCTDHRAEHIVKILRCNCGDTLRIGIINGKIGEAKVLEIHKNRPYSVTIETDLYKEPPPPPTIDIILALPRPIMLKRILSQATTLGIGHFYIIHSRRVEKSFWHTTMIEPEEYTTHLLTGLEQAAVDTRLPTMSFHRRFKPFIEDFFPEKKEYYDTAIIAHPTNNQGRKHSISDSISAESERIVLAVGPEGGWIDYEVEKFCEQGFICCSAGKRILKVDTAVIALLAQVICCQNAVQKI